MDSKAITNISFEGKKDFKLPKGATVLSKETSMRVEEIENGFLVRKNFEVSWQDSKGEKHWDHINKTWFSTENPITINDKELSLADKL